MNDTLKLGEFQAFYEHEGEVFAEFRKGDVLSPVWILSGDLRCTTGGGVAGRENQRNRFEFINRQGKSCVLEVPLEHWAQQASEFLKPFLNRGLKVNHGQYGLVSKYIKSLEPATFEIGASATGWHIADGKISFVLPSRTLGEQSLIYSGELPELTSQHGCNADEWFEAMREPLTKSSAGLFFLGVALASPLVELVSSDLVGIFQLVGRSSSGKSSIAKMCASVYGPSRNFLKSWNSTRNGLEILLSQRNDLFLCLDEASTCKGSILSGVAYDLHSGESKGVMTRERKAGAKLHWRLLSMSTSELSIQELCQRDNLQVDAGSLVRSPHVRVPDSPMGAFDGAQDELESRRLAELTTSFCEDNGGSIGLQWLEHVVENFDRIEREGKAFVAKTSAVWATTLTPQAMRGSKRFALVAFALREAMASFGIDRLADTDAICKGFFEAWVSELGLDESLEKTKTLDNLQSYLAKNRAKVATLDCNDEWKIPFDCIAALKEGAFYLYANRLLEATMVSQSVAVSVLLKEGVLAQSKSSLLRVGGVATKVYKLNLQPYEKSGFSGFTVSVNSGEQPRADMEGVETSNRRNQPFEERELNKDLGFSEPVTPEVAPEGIWRTNALGQKYLSNGACGFCGVKHSEGPCGGGLRGVA